MSNFKRLPLAVAVAMAMGTGFSYAQEVTDGVDLGLTGRTHSDIDIDKTVDVDYNLSYWGNIYTLGLVLVDSSAAAFSEVKQKTRDNKLSDLVIDPETGAVLSTPGSLNTDNNATLNGNVLSDATGNAGVNVAAGDNNAQQNSVAIAEGDSLNGSLSHSIDFSHSKDKVDNDSGTWTKDVHLAAGAGASHSVTDQTDLTSSSNAHLNVDLDVDDKIDLKTPDGGNYSLSSVIAGGAAGEFDADIGGDIGEQDDLNALSAEGEFVAGGLLGIEGGTIDYGVAGRDEESWSRTESSSQGAYIEGSVDYSEDGSWTWVDEEHYAFSASFDINLLFGGAAEAETFSDQYSYSNENPSSGTNDAFVGDSVGSGFSGNIGVNVVAGQNNAQANQLALAENSGVMALATASSNQTVHDNLSVGQGSTEELKMPISLAGAASGTYQGVSDQVGDVYPDIWEGDHDAFDAGGDGEPHPGGPFWGHADFDGATQGAADAPILDENGNQVGVVGPGGALLFNELGTVDLDDIQLTGMLPVVQVMPNAVVNNATLAGDAFSEASGNIAINVAAGNGNLQGNALAIASIGTPAVAPGE